MTSKIADLDSVEKRAMTVLGARGRVQLLRSFPWIRILRTTTMATMNVTLSTIAQISWTQKEVQLARLDGPEARFVLTGIFVSPDAWSGHRR
jgi:hypothetical protein